RSATRRRLSAASVPPAVTFSAALERMDRRSASLEAGPAEAIESALVTEADAIAEEDIESCRRIGRFGAELLAGERAVLTHCNAGALATAGYGTALGVVRGAVEAGQAHPLPARQTPPHPPG